MPAPCQFKDLGKKAKDLFKKQYDYKNEIKVFSKASGVKLESGGTKGKDLVGYTNAKWKDEYLGDIEVDLKSCGAAKAQFKLCKVADGVDVTVCGDAKGDISTEATYKNGDMLSALAKATHNVNKSSTKISASAVVGFEGVSVGGGVDLDGSGNPTDYNVGAEYATKDLVASLYTTKQGEDITVSFFQKLSGCTSLGASMLVTSAGSRTFTFGSDHALDKKTGLKLKADSAGVVGMAVSHVLSDPKMKVGMSAEFDAAGDDALKAQKFGVCLSFGEF